MRRTNALAALVIGLSAAVAHAHGGQYQPPAPVPRGNVPPGLPPTGGGPTTGGGGPGGPVTGGGGGGTGPVTGGGADPTGLPGGAGGPVTGGGGGPGPSTGGGGGPGPATGPGPGKGPTTGPTTGGGLTGGSSGGGLTGGTGYTPPTGPATRVLPGWARWWYANRTQLIEWNARAPERARDLTPGAGSGADDLFLAEVRAALSDALSHRNEDISSGAAIALGKDGDPSAAPALLAVARDAKRQQPVREAAALALGLLRVEPGPAATDTRRGLAAIGSDEREPDRLRAMALYALGLRGEMASAPLLLDIAGRAAARWDVPAAALTSLGLGGHDLTIPELLTYLEGTRRSRRNDRVRRVYAAHALARAGALEALPALRAATRDADGDVRRAAVLALGALATPDDDDSADALIRVISRDKHEGVRHAAALSLGRVGHDRAEVALRYAFLKGDAQMMPFAALGLGLFARHPGHEGAAAPVVKALVRRSNAEVRAPLAIACGLARDAAAAPTLRGIVADGGDTALRAHAALALGLIGDETAIPDLRTVLEDEAEPEIRRETALSLGMLGDVQATGILRELVADGGSVYVSGSAAVALGRIGGVESGRALLALLQNERRPDLARAMAAVGLGLMLDQSEGARLATVGADLDWDLQTSAVHEILTIL